MAKKAFSITIRVAISLGLILILLYIMRGKYGKILEVLRTTDALIFGIGVGLFFLAITTSSFRLKLIIDAQENMSITFLEALSLTFIGYFFNNFLPTSIGGDVVKAYYQARKTGDNTVSYTSVFVDRAIGLLTMVFMAFIALFFVDSSVIDPTVKIMIYSITAVSVLVIIFMMNKQVAKKFSRLLSLVRPIEDKLRKIYNAVHGYRKHSLLIVQSILISIVSQLFFFASIGIMALSIGSRIPPLDILLKMPVISMMSMLPSINGLGLREGATVLFFGPLIGKANAFAISILWLAALFMVSIVGGVIYSISPQFKLNIKQLEGAEGAK